MATKSRKKHKSKRELEEAALAKQMRPVTRLLLGLTSDLDWGEKYADSLRPCPVHVNTKDTMRQFLERTSYVYPKRLSQEALVQHFQGKRTLYFTGSRGNQTLVYIDPDCHKSGSKEGAFQFLEYLKGKYFRNLYYEASTHGNGGSGYIIVDTSSCSEWDFNVLLKQFDKFLKRVLATTTFDVEDVEAKGAIPEVNWNPKYKHVLDSVKCGGLAKFPREMLTRADEFMNTTRLTTDALQAMVDSVPEPPPVVEEESAKCAVKGSILGKHIDPELVKCYLPLARDFMDSYCADKAHRVGNGTKAIAQDLAVILAMVESFTLHPNEDGSMPHARFQAMWDAMFKCGDIARAWDNKRFAYLRNMLSDLGFIEWKDETYIPPPPQPKGGKVKGKAMRWHGSEELMETLAKCRENGAAQTITDEEAVVSINNAAFGHTLSGKQLSEMKKHMAEAPIIRPKRVFAVVYKWFDDIEGIEKAMNRRKKAA